MTKPLSFSRKGWIALGVVGLVIALALTVWVLWPTEAPGVEEAIAQYAHKMENRPSAKTAAAMLDYAIDWGDDKLVFSVLKKHIYPHTGVEGVLTEFERGSRWYINSTMNTDNTLWLAEEIRALSPQVDLNEDLANFYLKLSVGQGTLKSGNRLFAHWSLNGAARAHYLKSIADLLAKSPLPLEPGQGYPGSELVDEFPHNRGDVAEFTDAALYLMLWEKCFQDQLDEEFSSLLKDISPESDPLGLYGSIWAVALLRDLEEGWHNPRELDVAEKIPDVISRLGATQLEQVFEVLYAKRDPASSTQVMALLELLASTPLSQEFSYQAIVLLLNSAGFDSYALDKPVYTVQDRLVFSPEVQELYLALKPDLDTSQSAKKLETLLNLEVPKSDLKLQKSMDFYVQHQITFSSFEPAALIMSDQGHTLLDIKTLKETSYPGYWGSWSAKGDKFALIKSEGGSSTVRVLAASGQELQRYTLSLDLPMIHGDYGAVFVPYTRWHSPWQLTIAYTSLGLYYDDYPDQRAFSLDLNSQELKEISHQEGWKHYRHLPGTDLYYDSTHMYSSEAVVGQVLEVLAQQSVKLPEQNAELCIEDHNLVLKTATETVLLQESLERIVWAAATQEELFVMAYPPQESDPISYESILAVTLQTGGVRELKPDNPWFGEAEFVIRGDNQQTTTPASYFAKGNWVHLNDWEDLGDNISLHAHGTQLPVILPGWGAVRMYISGDQYILVAIQVRIYHMLDVHGTVLVFN